jgi:hypothetical protein
MNYTRYIKKHYSVHWHLYLVSKCAVICDSFVDWIFATETLFPWYRWFDSSFSFKNIIALAKSRVLSSYFLFKQFLNIFEFSGTRKVFTFVSNAHAYQTNLKRLNIVAELSVDPCSKSRNGIPYHIERCPWYRTAVNVKALMQSLQLQHWPRIAKW